MAKKQFYKTTGTNVLRIFKVLQKAWNDGEDFVTVSEIAKRCSLHKWTVSRTVDLYMGAIVEVVQPQELEAIGLQVKLVKLRDPSITAEKVLSYLKVRRKIKA